MFARIAIVALTLSALLIPGFPRDQGVRAGGEPRVDWVSDPTCQVVFFAVLEGLYRDGVPNEVVDRVLDIQPKKGPRFDTHFVYCCPLCHPAYEAFMLYRQRDRFYGRKDGADTLGGGIEPSLVRKLQGDNLKDRLDALQVLIKRWVTLRLDSMRLTAKEKDEWAERLAIRRKQGMEALEKVNFAGKNSGYQGCAICDGSANACPLKP